MSSCWNILYRASILDIRDYLLSTPDFPEFPVFWMHIYTHYTQHGDSIYVTSMSWDSWDTLYIHVHKNNVSAEVVVVTIYVLSC